MIENINEDMNMNKTSEDLGEKLNEKEDFNDNKPVMTSTGLHEKNINKLRKSIKILQNVSK